MEKEKYIQAFALVKLLSRVAVGIAFSYFYIKWIVANGSSAHQSTLSAVLFYFQAIILIVMCITFVARITLFFKFSAVILPIGYVIAVLNDVSFAEYVAITPYILFFITVLTIAPLSYHETSKEEQMIIDEMNREAEAIKEEKRAREEVEYSKAWQREIERKMKEEREW